MIELHCCPVCDGDDLITVFTTLSMYDPCFRSHKAAELNHILSNVLGLKELLVNTRMCKQCFHLFLSPTFSPQEISILYSKRANSLMGSFYKRAEEYSGASLQEQTVGSKILADRYSQDSLFFRGKFIYDVVNSFSKKPIKRILDIGGRDGSNILAFKDAEKFVYDLSMDRNRVGEVIFIDLKGEDQSITPFDLMVSTHTMEHIVNLKDALSYYTRFCKQDGLFYVEVPMQYIYVFLKRLLFPILKKGAHIQWHVNYFTQTSLRALFELCGYETLYFKTRFMTYGFIRIQVFVALFKYTKNASTALTSRTKLSEEFLLDLIKAIGTEVYQKMVGRYPALRSYRPVDRYW